MDAPAPADDLTLWSELSLALAWLSLVRHSHGAPDEKIRCEANLWRIYESVLRLIAATPLTDAQESDIWRRLGPVQDFFLRH